jgi:hypothetical protein
MVPPGAATDIPTMGFDRRTARLAIRIAVRAIALSGVVLAAPAASVHAAGVADTVTVLPPVDIHGQHTDASTRTTATQVRLNRGALNRFQPSTTGDALATVPGVTRVGLTSHLPMYQFGWNGEVTLETGNPWQPQDAPLIERSWIGGDYFKAMGIDIVRGRVFDEHDRAGAPVAARAFCISPPAYIRAISNDATR